MKKLFIFLFLIIPFFAFSQTDTIPQSEIITRVFKVRKTTDWLKIKLFYDSVQIASSDPISIRKLKRITFSDNTFLTTAFDGSHWNLVGNVLSPKITTNKVTTDSGYYIGINRLLFGSLKNIYLGHNCGGQNSGDYFTGLGAHCGMLNTANNFTSAGAYSGKSNTGTNFSGFGYNSGYENAGFNFSGFGSYSGYKNTGNNVLALGATSGYSNNLDSAIYIGFGTVGFDTSNILLFGRQTLKNPHFNINANVNVSHILDAHKYINTDSSYYLKGIEFIKANHNLGNQFIGVGSGANNIVDSINNPPYGYLGVGNTANGYYSLYSNTTGSGNIANGYYSLYSNTTGNNNVAMGAVSLYSNTTGYHNVAMGAVSLYSNTTGSGNIAIGYNSGQYADTAANGLLWIGEGDYNNAIIYGNMLTDSLRLNANVNVGTNLMINQSATIGTNLTVHDEIINGGLINKDTVLILADDETFEFPTTSVGWAEIQCDSVLIEKTWGIVSWNGDGSTSLRSNGAKFVNTDTDGNYACFYNNGSVAYLKNTSGYTLTYSIKLHYHN